MNMDADIHMHTPTVYTCTAPVITMPIFQYITKIKSKHTEIEQACGRRNKASPSPSEGGWGCCMYIISQQGEGELDIAAGTFTVKRESAKTRLLLTVRAEFAFVHSGSVYERSQNVTFK